MVKQFTEEVFKIVDKMRLIVNNSIMGQNKEFAKLLYLYQKSS